MVCLNSFLAFSFALCIFAGGFSVDLDGFCLNRRGRRWHVIQLHDYSESVWRCSNHVISLMQLCQSGWFLQGKRFLGSLLWACCRRGASSCHRRLWCLRSAHCGECRLSLSLLEWLFYQDEVFLRGDLFILDLDWLRWVLVCINCGAAFSLSFSVLSLCIFGLDIGLTCDVFLTGKERTFALLIFFISQSLL